MSKALVISGGGSKGAFAVGVVKDLVEKYLLNFELMVGTSTGSLIVPLAAMKDIQTLEKLYTTVTDADILEKHNLGERLNSSSIYSARPLTERIKSIYTDDFFNQLKNCGTDIYLTTVCLQTEELVVFTTARHPVANSYYKVRSLVNGEHFRRAVLASASQPIFMPPVKVNKQVPGETFPEYQFVDGGVREYAGVGIATEAGASEIFTILHASKRSPNHSGTFETMPDILMQTVSTFITDVSDNDLYVPNQFNVALKYIKGVKNNMRAKGISDTDIAQYFTVNNPGGPFQNRDPLKIHLIRPELPLGGGPGGLVFEPVEMREMMDTGKMALQSYVANLMSGFVDWA